MFTNTPHHSHPSPRILQVSTSDIGGGAEKIAWDLHHGYRARGHWSYLAVGRQHSEDPTVFRIPHDAYQAWWLRLSRKMAESPSLPMRIRRLCAHLAKFHHRHAKKRGHENFYFPGSQHLLKLPPQTPDIVHCHNLHGLYFDLRYLPRLSSQRPVVITLHDAWLLGGHCAHSFDCDRWQSGCGRCPYLEVTIALTIDGSAYNWRRKRKIYARSRIYAATPSRWLMRKVEQSILTPAIIEARVIPHGIDLSVFHPADQQNARQGLGIPQNAQVLLFTAVKARQSFWKDYQTLRQAVERLANTGSEHPLRFLALGEDGQEEQVGRATLQFIPHQPDPRKVAQYYQAADLYVHAAKADNFPTVILESLACGTPAIATAIGGIPEQIEDGVTGFLVPPGNPEAMAMSIQKILADAALRRHMSLRAVEIARQRFDVNRMVDAYLAWYREILTARERD